MKGRRPCRGVWRRSLHRPTRSGTAKPAAEFTIIATPIKHAEFQGLRVTPNVYTTLDDIDRFMSAIDEVLAHGVPTA